jgi:hypothetical protein
MYSENARSVHRVVGELGMPTRREVSERLGLPLETVRNLLDKLVVEGHVSSVMVGREWCFEMADVPLPVSEREEREARSRRRAAVAHRWRAGSEGDAVWPLLERVRSAGMEPSVVQQDGKPRIRVRYEDGWAWIDDPEDIRILQLEVAA